MNRTIAAPRAICLGLLLLPAFGLAAQRPGSDRFMDNCRNDWSRDRETACETRDFSLPVTKTINADGRENGGVTVHGWDKNEIHVVAMIQTQASSEADARDLAKEVRVLTDGGGVRAEGPRSLGRRQSWSVSYEIWVPRATELRLSANNGGLSVDGVDARMDMETSNGGIHLVNVDGDVRGATTNGGVTVELSGDRWRGAGLDVRTSNGGVHLIIPSGYSARLETGTVNGGMEIDFPITVQGSIGRRIATQLGNGGSTIRAVTTNGGVSIRRR